MGRVSGVAAWQIIGERLGLCVKEYEGFKWWDFNQTGIISNFCFELEKNSVAAPNKLLK
jgi:hypothetical protein